MALAVTVSKVGTSGATGIRVTGTLVASGNYTTNGDALDLRDRARLARRDPHIVRVWGQKGYMYSYDHTNRKLLVHTTANTELAGAPTAYPAGVTGDTIRFEAWYVR